MKPHLHIPANLKSDSRGLDENPISDFLKEQSIVKTWHGNGLSIKENLGRPAVSGEDKLLLLYLNVERHRTGSLIALHGPSM